MYLLLPVLILLVVLFLPSLWVKRVMRRYSQPEARYAVTGAAAARRLLDLHGLQTVQVEVTKLGDHYDPHDRVVRLSPSNHDSRSLTAVTIAAHEVGHAVQQATGYGPLRLRTQLVRLLGPLEKAGAALLMAAPLILAATRAPSAGGLMLVGGLLTLGSAILVHLVTLPMEFDASFRRALPMLADNDVLIPGDEQHARRLLTAAAMTYVSASLMSLFNIARWWTILRR